MLTGCVLSKEGFGCWCISRSDSMQNVLATNTNSWWYPVTTSGTKLVAVVGCVTEVECQGQLGVCQEAGDVCIGSSNTALLKKKSHFSPFSIIPNCIGINPTLNTLTTRKKDYDQRYCYIKLLYENKCILKSICHDIFAFEKKSKSKTSMRD